MRIISEISLRSRLLYVGALFEPSANALEQLRPVGWQLVLGLTKRPSL
jgi:hypothetical protein